MGKLLLHPRARLALIAARTEEANARAREACATPGFGFLVLFYDTAGARYTRHASTYADAHELRGAEMAANPRFEKSWIIQKAWADDMSLTPRKGRPVSPFAYNPWRDEDVFTQAPEESD